MPEWQCPKMETDESHKLGWINEACEQGAAWKQMQRGTRDWRKALEIISGDGASSDNPNYRSLISGKRLKAQIRTAVSVLADIRPFWGWHGNDNVKSFCTALNKASRALYLKHHWNRSVKDALAFAAATDVGFIRPVYRRNMRGHGDIELDAFGSPSVLPVQMPRDGDYKNAYVVNLLEEIPIFDAHWRWPDFQDRLRPTQSRYWYSSEIRKSADQNQARRLSNFFGLIGGGKHQDKLTDQYIPLRWSRVNDLRINDTGHRIAMGQLGTSWYYEVPSYGDEIPDGAGGRRTADENDCRIYPQGRMLVSSESCLLYDGPDFNWHGDLDLIPVFVDKWPWEPDGFSMVHDGAMLQQEIDRIDQGIMNKLRAQQDPSLAYPLSGVTKQEAESFDPFAQRERIGYDDQAVEAPFKLAVPLEVYQVGQEQFAARQLFQDEMDFLFQTRDMVELAKTQGLGKDMDSLEKFLSAYGPVVRDICVGIEKSICEVGKQVGWLIVQYMPTHRLIQYADPADLSFHVFDYDPTSLIPSHLPHEDPHNEDQSPKESSYTKMQRAKWFMQNVEFLVVPHSAHEIAQMTLRLGYMQLRARGYPISAATVLQAWQVPNLADPNGNTEQERYYAELEEDITKKVRLAQIAKELGIEGGLIPTAPSPIQGKNPGGRPNTDAIPPQMEVKGDGRPLISTSQ